ncbi:hypothetical protein FQN49_005110 [Arthroderma sp. PD_2]|nr:hypothetical protein FQN49_005110 [Arthroderma sp. PD_2]
MPVPLSQDLKDSAAKEATSDPNGKNINEPPTTTSTTSESASNTSQTTRGTARDAMTQEEADRLYEERMEEEYAKREGGA